MSADDRVPSDAELQKAERALRRTLAGTGIDLDDAALWVEPSAELEDAVMREIGEPDVEAPPMPHAIRVRSRGRWIAAAASIAAVLAIGIAIGALRSDSPDWEIALFPTDAAAGATGVVKGWNEASGTRVELDLSGLAPAPDGFVYELWFSNEEVHVSAGTFHGTADDVTLWAGVSRGDFPRVWITLEPLDGDQGPTTNLLDSDTVA